jgi:hypothetical protein
VKNLLQNNSSLPSELGVLCVLAGVNSLCSNIPDTEKFAPAAQTFEHSSTEFAEIGVFVIKNSLLCALGASAVKFSFDRYAKCGYHYEGSLSR